MNRVGFIGSPDAQSVSRQILDLGKCDIAIWDPDQGTDGDASKPQCVSLEDFADIPLIVLTGCIDGCRQIARNLGDVITGRHVVVHTIRGLEVSSLKRVSTILQEETPTQRIGFVTGPMRLSDLDQGLPASAVCASYFPEVHDLVEEAMCSERLRVYRSRDLAGAELAAGYSRLIALMSGLADALELGPSLQATLFARGLAEIGRFIVEHDGHERTSFGLSGAGNLYVDTIDDGSLDFEIGRHLATTSSRDADELTKQFGAPATEILDLLDAFEQMATNTSLELHLLDAASALLTSGLDSKDVIGGLMALPVLYE